jgi:hypothetical protein
MELTASSSTAKASERRGLRVLRQAVMGSDFEILSEGQSTYVPLGAKHRLENPGTTLMVLIEVQIGTYLGEDDITRYDDVYNRIEEESE